MNKVIASGCWAAGSSELLPRRPHTATALRILLFKLSSILVMALSLPTTAWADLDGHCPETKKEVVKTAGGQILSAITGRFVMPKVIVAKPEDPTLGDAHAAGNTLVVTGLSPVSCAAETEQHDSQAAVGNRASSPSQSANQSSDEDESPSSDQNSPGNGEADAAALTTPAIRNAVYSHPTDPTGIASTGDNATRTAEAIFGPIPAGNHIPEIDVDAMVDHAEANVGNPLSNASTANASLMSSSNAAVSNGSAAYSAASAQATSQAFGVVMSNSAATFPEPAASIQSNVTRPSTTVTTLPQRPPPKLQPVYRQQAPNPAPVYTAPKPAPLHPCSTVTGTGHDTPRTYGYAC